MLIIDYRYFWHICYVCYGRWYNWYWLLTSGSLSSSSHFDYDWPWLYCSNSNWMRLCLNTSYSVGRRRSVSFGFSWFSSYNTEVLETDLRVKAVDGILSLSSVEERDGGNYTCQASNIAATKSLSVSVIVSGTVKITFPFINLFALFKIKSCLVALGCRVFRIQSAALADSCSVACLFKLTDSDCILWSLIISTNVCLRNTKMHPVNSSFYLFSCR